MFDARWCCYCICVFDWPSCLVVKMSSKSASTLWDWLYFWPSIYFRVWWPNSWSATMAYSPSTLRIPGYTYTPIYPRHNHSELNNSCNSSCLLHTILLTLYHFNFITKYCNSHHVVGQSCLAQWFIHSISVAPTIVFLTQLPLNPLSKGATKGTKLELTWA